MYIKYLNSILHSFHSTLALPLVRGRVGGVLIKNWIKIFIVKI